MNSGRRSTHWNRRTLGRYSGGGDAGLVLPSKSWSVSDILLVAAIMINNQSSSRKQRLPP